jgi:hypothetical protein
MNLEMKPMSIHLKMMNKVPKVLEHSNIRMIDNNTKYKNVAFNELMTYAKENPNKTHKLNSIEIKQVAKSNNLSLDTLGLTGYVSNNLTPSGILSLFAFINDPDSYSIISSAVKSTLISNLATSLQEGTDALKNTHLSRKRKKLHDLIGAAYNSPIMDDKDYFDLFNGLSYMRNTNFILLKSTNDDNIQNSSSTEYKGEIYFSSDPTNWKYDTPIWIADYRARWIASTDNKNSIHTILPTWISSIEQNGWIINWPEVDGTKEEIVEKLSILPTWSITDKGLKKEILAKRLGRSNVIQIFTKWMMKIDSNVDIE